MMKRQIRTNALATDTAYRLTDAELASVKGGAWYVKFDGVDGSSQHKDHDRWVLVESMSLPMYR